MKELHGGASGTVSAPPERCLAVLRDVEAYARWYPEVVREVTVLETGPDGEAERIQTVLRAAVGKLSRDLRLIMAVTAGADTVKLARVPHEPNDPEYFDVTWQVEAADAGSHIQLSLDAALEVPRLVPLGGVGDSMANGFVVAAVREIERG